MRRRRAATSRAVAAGLGAILLVGAAVVISNPRHRAFYFGGVGGTSNGRRNASASRPAGTPAAAAREIRDDAGAITVKRYVPRPDATGRIHVPIADQAPWRLPAQGVPPGWELKEFSGRAGIETVRSDGRLAARLRTDQGSFALYRDAAVDLQQFPWLTWSWKVARLPAGGDVRNRVTDDEAAQVYVIFPRWPSPLTTSDVIGYVWDTRAPAGTRLVSPKADNVRIIVVESGPGRLDRWLTYERNVAADYALLFERRPPRVGKVALMIDADDTRGRAEALVGDLFFSRGDPGKKEIPTSMLR